MKLWLISQNVNRGYDTYDSAVVAAETEKLAKLTHPSEYYVWHENGWYWKKHDGTIGHPSFSGGDWTARYQDVRCEYIGQAREGMPAGVVCSSFNAG